MRVLALDEAYSCGWAIGNPDDGITSSGCIAVDRMGGNDGAMLCRFSAWLSDLIRDLGITHVFVEELPLAKKASKPATVFPRVKMLAAIEMVCADLGIPCAEVSIWQWRKLLFGHTTKPKDNPASSRDYFKGLALKECDRRGWTLTSHGDDEADACGIAHFGLACLDPVYRRNAYRDAKRRAA